MLKFIILIKYIILFLSVSLSGIICEINKEEGAECEWEGLKGKCVKQSKCLTILDKDDPKHPICSEKDGESIICCTDCELVEDTKNAVLSPTGGVYWKDGRKARDNCLQYLKDLPYQCKQTVNGGIERELDGEKKCYKYGVWAVGGAPPKGRTPSAEYPHQVLLGYGDDLQTAKWSAGGFIISDKFIVTAAHALREFSGNHVKFLAMGVKNQSDAPESWQIHQIKRLITYSEFKPPAKYHDIALIETEAPIKFDENVLPACLHVDEDATIRDAVATTWLSLAKNTSRDVRADTIQTIKVEEFSAEECKDAYPPNRLLKNGYDHATQLCYGSKTDKTNPFETCKGLSGEPLLINTQFSSCVHTAIGITSFGKSGCRPNASPDIFTRVAHYVPWIEGIVWP